MTRARREQVSLDATPYYHCVGRCVRRAFLCGRDDFAGKDYEHRRSWIVERLHTLSQVFAIDIAAYAVMSNHYHLVLRIDAARLARFSEQEVAERWARLYAWPSLVARYLAGQTGSEAENDVARAVLAEWRQRLADLSWYMRCLNEHLARRANAEDRCTGRFWEGRFKSQAILDDAGLLTCMSYVDLNPIRAGLASTPELSDYTSIRQRLRALAAVPDTTPATGTDRRSPLLPPLLPFVGNERLPMPDGIAFAELDYLQLVDWAGRAVRPDKRGVIPADTPPLLARLRLTPEAFLKQMQPRALRLGSVIGTVQAARAFADQLHRRFLRGPLLTQIPAPA